MAIRRPLEGMLVLDLGQIYNGPYCGLQLGFMGARVLKIEPPEGDVVRRRKREVEPWPLVMLNSNKESVVLDLKQPRGKQIFLELVAKADVLIENFAVGVMDRLGIGWDVLHKLNPRLVYGGSSGFGLDGPYRDLAAMDVTIQAMSGIMNSTGHARRAADQGGRRRLRLPGGHPSLRRHPGRARPARAHRPGPARRGRHARGGRDRARLGHGRGDGRRHQRARAHRQPPSRARHGALQHLPVQRRLRRDLHLGRTALAVDVRPAGTARPRQEPRICEHGGAGEEHGGDRRHRRRPGRSGARRTRC